MNGVTVVYVRELKSWRRGTFWREFECVSEKCGGVCKTSENVREYCTVRGELGVRESLWDRQFGNGGSGNQKVKVSRGGLQSTGGCRSLGCLPTWIG